MCSCVPSSDRAAHGHARVPAAPARRRRAAGAGAARAGRHRARARRALPQVLRRRVRIQKKTASRCIPHTAG